MNIFIEKGDVDLVIKKIQETPTWLSPQIIQEMAKEKPYMFARLVENGLISQTQFNLVLEQKNNLDYLENNLTNFPKFKTMLNQSIARPLTDTVFNSPLLLASLDKSEYEAPLKAWLDAGKFDIKPRMNIAKEIQPFLNSDDLVKAVKKNCSFNLKLLNAQEFTSEFVLQFFKAHRYQSVECYQLAPQNVKDDEKVARALVEQDKQNFKLLTHKAMSHASVLHEALDSVIYPEHDGDSFSTDKTAIKTKDVPLNAVLLINNPIIFRLFKDNPKLLNIKELQDKWLNDKSYDEQLIALFNHLPKANQDRMVDGIKQMDFYDKLNTLYKNPKLSQFIIDTKNEKETLNFMLHHLENFSQDMKKLGLEKFANTHLPELIEAIKTTQHPPSDRQLAKFAQYLMKEKKDSALALDVMKFGMDQKKGFFLNENTDYLYGVSHHVFKEIEFDLMNYAENQTQSKKKNKIK